MNHGKRGFTLIELLITIAILTAVSVAGFIGLSKYKGGQNVDLSMEELTSVIRDVQKRSITEQDGKQWGIRFSNASSSYEIWSGTSYASGTVDRLYSLGRNVYFGNPSTSTLDTIFSVISGKLSEARVISLVNPRKDGIVGDIILTERGTVTNRLENGLVGYWHFDEATGTNTFDSSGESNTGSFVNAPSWSSVANCKAGSCLSFDGIDDAISIPASSGKLKDLTDDGNSFSFVGWFKPSGLPQNTYDGYLFFRAGYHEGPFYRKTDGELRAVAWYYDNTNTTITTGTTLQTGTWYHIAITVDESTNQFKLYLDGSQIGSTANLTKALREYGTTNYRIGGNGTYSAYGLVDEVRFYNKVLSDTEILDLYNDLK